MQSVNFAELLNLVVIHKTEVNQEMSNLANVIVSVGALFGIVFGAVMYKLYNRKTTYSPVDTTMPPSEHI